MAACYTSDDIKSWLEWAGSKLYALDVGRVKPASYRGFWPDMVPELFSDSAREQRTKLARPSADEIPVMDEILYMVIVIPDSLRRRVVTCRAFVKPVSHRPVFGWERLAKLLHKDKRTLKHLQTVGLREIAELTPCDKMRRIAGFLKD